MKCEKCQEYNYVISCTIDQNGEHHSYNDEPAKIFIDGKKQWYKHGLRHRENGPSTIYHNGYSYWYYEEKMYYTGRKINKDIIEIPFIKDNKIAIIIKQIKFSYENVYNVYLCLIDNEIRHVLVQKENNDKKV